MDKIPNMASRQARMADTGQSTARKTLVAAEIDRRAAELFAARGFAGTSFQDIADAVGMTRQALYYYVKTKEELFNKLVSEITQTSVDDLKAINKRQDLDPRARLGDIARSIALHRAKNPHHFLLAVRSEEELPAPLQAEHVKGKREVLAELIRVIEEGMSSGDFKRADSRTAALAVLGMLNWIPWWVNPEEGTADAIAEQVSAMAVAAVEQHDKPYEEGVDPWRLIASMRADLQRMEDHLRSSSRGRH
jgi:AcrR family transcriptional regulator